MVESDRQDRDYECAVAFYAGRYGSCYTAGVQSWAADDPARAARARRDAAIERRIAREYEAVLREPIPPRLLAGRRGHRRAWLVRSGAAAAVVLAAVSTAWWPDVQRVVPTGSVNATGLESSPGPGEAAAVSETGAGMAPPIPDLSAQGYRLIGRKVVRDTPRTLTELTYEKNGGPPVRVYAQNRPPQTTSQPEVSMRDGRPLARWHAHGVNYALVGDLSASSLQELARGAVGSDHPAPAAQPQRRMPPANTLRPVEAPLEEASPTRAESAQLQGEM